MYLNIIKATCKNSTANITFNDEKLIAFSTPNISNKSRMPILTTSLQRILEIPARAIRQEKHIQGLQIRKGEVKFSLLADNMLYVENAKGSNPKTLKLINEFSKTEGYEINTQKSVVFIYTYK